MSDYKIGDKVRLLEDIWDDEWDMCDPRPRGYIAYRDEVVTVQSLDPSRERPVQVSDEEDNSFRVALIEIEPA